jgi:spore coat polysaccharide biosynthesis predicted glycosyltransferase SpsG
VHLSPSRPASEVQIGIITHGSRDIGLGHISRSMTVARALEARLKASGVASGTVFLIPPDDDAEKLLSRERMTLHILGAPGAFDLDWFRRELRHFAYDVLILDALDPPADLCRLIREHAPVVGHIDDYTPGRSLADVALNANLSPWTAKSHRAGGTLVLRGIENFIVNPDFAQKSEFHRKAGRILVSFGGTDPAHMTAFVLRVLRAILAGEASVKPSARAKAIHLVSALDAVRAETGETAESLFAGIRVDAVVSPSNPDLEALEAEFGDDERIAVNIDIGVLEFLLAYADVAVVAGGQTLVEAASMGVPAVTAPINAHQRTQSRYAERAGFAWPSGVSPKAPAAKKAAGIVTALARCIADVEGRRRAHDTAMTQPMGSGATNFAAALADLALARIRRRELSVL